MKATIVTNSDQYGTIKSVDLLLNGRKIKSFTSRPLLDSFLDGIVYTTGHDYMRDEKFVRDEPVVVEEINDDTHES